MAAGRITEPRLTTLTAMTLAVIRQVTKIVVIITNRCVMFIVKLLVGLGYIKCLLRKKRSIPTMITVMMRKTKPRE